MIREEGRDQTSYCQRENCWSRFSKCIDMKALERFLKQESADYEYSSSPAVPASK
jgi:hypothetical protein